MTDRVSSEDKHCCWKLGFPVCCFVSFHLHFTASLLIPARGSEGKTNCQHYQTLRLPSAPSAIRHQQKHSATPHGSAPPPVRPIILMTSDPLRPSGLSHSAGKMSNAGCSSALMLRSASDIAISGLSIQCREPIMQLGQCKTSHHVSDIV